DFMVEGDDESIMAWWVKHMHEHPIVLDYLVQHLVNLAERDYRTAGAQRSEGLWCAVMRLDRALGDAGRPRADASVEVLWARLHEAETEWLMRDDR
ncbi:MAG TPA: hypothetical protein VFZ65_05905, partial [Planctomycetota bacterium]|nr:hypothetical protein [Planctomycetota bacterium]